MASEMSRCDFEFSDFCSRHTVGVAGDDIMIHILVSPCHWYVWNDKFPQSTLVQVMAWWNK